MVEEHAGKDAYVSQMIRRKAKVLARQLGCDPHDVEQELWAHLLKSQDQFELRRSHFETFAERITTNKIRSMLRFHRAQKRDANREAFSVNDVFKGDDGEMTSRHETLACEGFPGPDRGDLDEDFRTFLAQLNATERDIVLLWLKTSSKEQARTHLRLARKDFEAAWARICQAAEGLDLHEYFGK